MQSKFANDKDADMSDELDPVLGKEHTNAGTTQKSKFVGTEDIEDEDSN